MNEVEEEKVYIEPYVFPLEIVFSDDFMWILLDLGQGVIM